MKGLLTPEEKKYLNFVSNYLRSHSLHEGDIDFEIDYDDYELPDWNTIEKRYITHFSNSWNVEIPEGLIPIIEKIWKYCETLDNFENDIENVSYQQIFVHIDAVAREITLRQRISYYDRSDGSSILYDSEEDKERFDRWMENEMSEIEVPSDGELVVRYNGSGDSGYIESQFEPTNDAVPDGVENWMYSELERHFGGWEINEGSDGQFIFNFNNSEITLVHTENYEVHTGNTLFEEKFGK